MRIRVLYFAAVRELVALDEESLDLPEEVTTVGAFYTYIAQKHPELAGRLAHVRVARNEVFATARESIAPGDVLALIPPVSGGA
ncbi:molybdopterin converting factor subunit 1 [Pendulispora albinea]|uniref:Molybdopterin synthase sulfur carrier subunit n=1 Tax=Pendulispora albinea TaxID=2741071 RepID=A0ABZ2M5U6_9BACT